MGTCSSAGVEKKLTNIHESRRSSKFRSLPYKNLLTSYYEYRSSHRVKYQEDVRSTFQAQIDEVQYSQCRLLEPKEYLEKLFTLCACTLITQKTSIYEINNIISEMYERSELDAENYFTWMNENEETAIEVAIKAGNKVMVGLLLEMRYEGMYSDAFLVACRKRNKEIVKLLLERSAHEHLDMHVQTECVLICVKRGYSHILKMLHSAGFCLRNRDNFVSLKSPAASHVPLLWKEYTDGSLLHIAAGNGHHRIMDYLIQCDADIESIDSSGRRPIHLAVQGGIYCLRILLHAGVDLTALDNEGHSPLFLAASFGNFSALRILEDNGAELDTENDDGVSALATAALSNNDRIVKYLLDQGATFIGKCPNQFKYISAAFPEFIQEKALCGRDEVKYAKLKLLEGTGSFLPTARIRLHLGISPKIILAEAVQRRHRPVVELLVELDSLENAALLALKSSSLGDFRDLIMRYAYPRRLPNSVLVEALRICF